MDDLMGKIQGILSDKESMEQLSQLAQMFSQPQGDAVQGGAPAQNIQNTGLPLGAQQQGIDMNKLLALQSVMARASQPDKNRDFLIALKPLLKEESQRKVDRLISLFRIMALLPALKESGILGGDLLGIL